MLKMAAVQLDGLREVSDSDILGILPAEAKVLWQGEDFGLSDGVFSSDELEKFAQILKAHGLTYESGKVATCNHFSFKRECPNGHMAETFNFCGERSFCPRCARSYASRKAREVYEFLERNFAGRLGFRLRVVQIVFTLPHDLDSIEPSEFKRIVRELTPAGTTGWLVVQKRSTSNPFMAHSHVHLFFLNVILNEDKNGRFYFRRGQHFFTDAQREKLRRGFQESLVEHGFTLKTEVATPNFSYASMDQRGRVLHMLGYAYRREVQDVAKFLVKAGNRCECEQCATPGVSPSSGGYVQSIALSTLLTGDERVARWGWLLRRDVRHWLLTATLAQIHRELIRQSKLCPVCGLRMFRIRPIPPDPGDWGELRRDMSGMESSGLPSDGEVKLWELESELEAKQRAEARRARMEGW